MYEFQSVLVVEHCPQWHGRFKEMLSDFTIATVDTLSQAVVAVTNMRWAAIVVDLGVPDWRQWETWHVFHGYLGMTPLLLVDTGKREPEADLLVCVVGKDTLQDDPPMCQNLVYELMEERRAFETRYPEEVG